MKTRLATTLAAAVLAFAGVNLAQAAQVSAAVGATGQGDMTYRIGLSFDWDKKWLESGTGHLTGYWDAAYTYWEGGEASGAHSLSISPVFVYEFSGFTYTPFIEAGIGLAAFSKTDVGDQRLGSSVNFEDRIGFGLKLPAEQKIGIRAIHYSNAGLKQPNDGIESYSLFYSKAF
ncbi:MULTISPECIES: acyloxyacyl hydrolase [unclassified Pseudomonas]|uniref:acyloxyacyl hydrolase n=1 Tax=unclassified Pseudomonas TaxID=196821 RepID=UPI000C88B32B|nr:MULTISPECIES: acyloxyacyl hydrolase [unclassified Pseudomonas]PNA01060.1 acyloxyacyl hydrolase [Pseudomonas sp. FW305-42]PNA21077.1 acyloxyacyl hydrolase [Pseudomonas sp. MPR-R1B]PNB28087.1 acyloxyacyl hydrolase [Pseudomonas sp. DP16D-E2]PNB45014.1 acyloxyacyl hydrolase [Pseudomonas sp. FW305-17]PNB64094.1 acyloxyacyl hydrolase [Pseudomonas sp. GW531-E2]